MVAFIFRLCAFIWVLDLFLFLWIFTYFCSCICRHRPFLCLFSHRRLLFTDSILQPHTTLRCDVFIAFLRKSRTKHPVRSTNYFSTVINYIILKTLTFQEFGAKGTYSKCQISDCTGEPKPMFIKLESAAVSMYWTQCMIFLCYHIKQNYKKTILLQYKLKHSYHIF